MELKGYQMEVIADLTRYLELLEETHSAAAAYRGFWREKGVSVGEAGLPPYQDIVPGAPAVCLKVPTGGGKTFLACCALRPIFDHLPFTKTKAVAWLVPSDAILAQTLKCLKSPGHPYRQRLERDFGMGLEVYSKQELLSGQNFSPASVRSQLSIMVLSYDSFRRQTKEGLKAFQENSALMGFKAMGRPERPIEGADETSLIQIVNQLSPLAIVDESHHARTPLSLEMLRDFAPCFVLDLTATPRKESNPIAFVSAGQLKREEMVKLPVIVYDRGSREEVLIGAIDLRRRLEETARAEERSGGRYIRPIVLFQAQPRGKGGRATFDKIKEALIEHGIPEEQIAIRTGEIDELKGVDLTSPKCPVRYILTVNALKEGWDCPFAYVLASLADRSSPVEVEQILGRVLRMPGARRSAARALNMAYVLTSSNDFDGTVQKIVVGLNSAGFSDRDWRAPELVPPVEPEGRQIPLGFVPAPSDEAGSEASDGLEPIPDEIAAKIGAVTERMIERAEAAAAAYDAEEHRAGAAMPEVPMEVQSKVKLYPMRADLREEAEALALPQFFCKVPSLFQEGGEALLDRTALAEGFTLRGKAWEIDFGAIDEDMARVDVEGDLPRIYKLSGAEQEHFRAWFSSLSPESRIGKCRDLIVGQLDRMDTIRSDDLRAYVRNIIEGLDGARLALLQKAPLEHARKIKEHIDRLLTEHCKRTFDLWLQTERIVCRPHWRLPAAIHPASTSDIGGSLYEAEEDMNRLERALAMELSALPGVLWWHRNIAKLGLCINGFIKHYPDFIVRTRAGRTVLVETKGEHLKNEDSMDKAEMGRRWASAAGPQYRYYMVFADGGEPLEGAYGMGRFLEIMREL